MTPFEIGRYPVTVVEYQRFVDAGGYDEKSHWQSGGFGKYEKPDRWEEQLIHPTQPVVGVSWYEAAAYADWAGCSLPTDPQWERAARGAEGREFPWGNDIFSDGDIISCYHKGNDWDDVFDVLNRLYSFETDAVGVHPQGATPAGIHDLVGNVWEWCVDRYVESYSHRMDKVDSEFRVLRGGDVPQAIKREIGRLESLLRTNF